MWSWPGLVSLFFKPIPGHEKGSAVTDVDHLGLALAMRREGGMVRGTESEPPLGSARLKKDPEENTTEW